MATRWWWKPKGPTIGRGSIKPEAAKLRTERMKSGIRPNPSVFCLPMGIPVNNFVTEVVKFIQAPKEIVVIYKVDGSYRQIYTDGRPLPKDIFSKPTATKTRKTAPTFRG